MEMIGSSVRDHKDKLHLSDEAESIWITFRSLADIMRRTIRVLKNDGHENGSKE